MRGFITPDSAQQKVDFQANSWNGVVVQFDDEPVIVDCLFVINSGNRKQFSTDKPVIGQLGQLSVLEAEVLKVDGGSYKGLIIAAEMDTNKGDKHIIMSIDVSRGEFIRPVFNRIRPASEFIALPKSPTRKWSSAVAPRNLERSLR
jgi:hypothetical protein